jgi:hypothetical protein
VKTPTKIKSEQYLDYEPSMKDELVQLSKIFKCKLNKMISSSISAKEDEIDGQYLFQFLDIVKSLLSVEDDNEGTLQDLIEIRSKIDIIMKDFGGTFNLKFQLEKLYIIANAKLKQLKINRTDDFESMRKTIRSSVSGTQHSMPRNYSVKKLRES